MTVSRHEASEPLHCVHSECTKGKNFDGFSSGPRSTKTRVSDACSLCIGHRTMGALFSHGLSSFFTGGTEAP